MPATTDNNNLKPSVLKTTRVAKGLTLDIVHEATKIPMDALKAIEEGYSVRILSPFYYRGFIKIYAQFLGLDVENVFEQSGLGPSVEQSVVGARKPVANARQEQPTNVMLEQALEWGGQLFSGKNFKKFVKIAVAMVVVVVVVKVFGFVVDQVKALPKERKLTQANKGQDKKIQLKVVEQAVRPPVTESVLTAPTQAVKAASENQKVSLVVRAIKDSWIQVKSDDKVVFQMTMKKGTMESWDADKTIELSGKNINELELEVNGKHISSLGGLERRARKVLITKEGLTVKK